MSRYRLGIASLAMASIGALLVSAVHESTSEWEGNNKLMKKGQMMVFEDE